jgi:4-diphosphocytidyl-2-C-methyl-D-erythritol kinase
VSPTSVTASAPAKINLHLGVGPVRGDGYHPLATVYQAIGLRDRVTVRRAAARRGFAVSVTGDPRIMLDDVPLDGRNIAVRAARLLGEHAGVSEPVDVHIDKGIPVAGGLAGGSADAAATLVACAAMWDLQLSTEELARLAAPLGSDVPFAVLGGTAVGTGHGEVVAPAMVRGEYWWVVVESAQGMSTPEVYREFDKLTLAEAVPDPEVPDDLMEALREYDVDRLAASLHNDLELPALRLRPDLDAVLSAGADAGALAGLLSGSGPSCLFLCAGEQHARQVAGTLRSAGHASVQHARGPAPGARVEEAR